jgi:hypothetical protein
MEQGTAFCPRQRREDLAKRSLPRRDDEDVALSHVPGITDVVHVRVIDEFAMNVPRGVAIGEWIRGSDELGHAAQIEHGGNSICEQRLATGRRQLPWVVRADEDVRTGETTVERQPTEVAGVEAVRPVEPAGA